MPKRLFSDKVEQEIEHKYNPENPTDRLSTCILAKEYSCVPTTIWNIVNKWGEMRNHKEAVNTESCKELMKQNNPFYISGENHSTYKNGKFKDKDGYILILKPDHPQSNIYGYIQEHRFIYENFLKENDPDNEFLISIPGWNSKWLNPICIPHHINEIKDDNRIENLQLFKNNSEHISFHWTLRKEKS